eukprot:CAMPEP_0119547834 /NCGR_PEP_ID=MMETSP1352-20130426/1870_1 /TAXON_ID=265584 /ORGANISM="Stauroneis constricta, Strain CCMP1120" /LENGTH=361 /DNA_ID=CAMNT_0007592889 /DNA_START=534 /DNA_END=1619 /DNA_ORIENTATION=-
MLSLGETTIAATAAMTQQQQQPSNNTTTKRRRRQRQQRHQHKWMSFVVLIVFLATTNSAFPITAVELSSSTAASSPSKSSALHASTVIAPLSSSPSQQQLTSSSSNNNKRSWAFWRPATATIQRAPPTTTTTRSRAKAKAAEAYEQRKTEWAKKYTCVQGLRDTFGTNTNALWGDLDAVTTRRLYKTLLPRALMQLWIDGIATPEEIAPLAYQARKAAKLYARERSQLPYRIMAQMMDGVRTYRQYGTFQPCGLSYEQLWEKYRNDDEHDLIDGDDITAKICFKILEKSCSTNQSVDQWLLSSSSQQQSESDDLELITKQLESDVRKLLLNSNTKTTSSPLTIQQYRTWRAIAKAKRRLLS